MCVCDSQVHLLVFTFFQESFFQWCFGVEEPDCFGALDLTNGSSILFFPRLPADYAIWMGKLHSLDDFKKRYAVDETYYTDEIANILKNKGATTLCTLVSIYSFSTFFHSIQKIVIYKTINFAFNSRKSFCNENSLKNK